jgi:hypothetical protein
MAPEQLRGQAVDARADVFAFGVLAFELASGAHPFGRGDHASLLERVVAEAPPLALDVQPPALAAIIRRCLRANPLDRYQSGGEIAAALRQVAGTSDTDMASKAPHTGNASAWWWQFHQVAVAALTITAVTILGFKHRWLGAWGATTFVIVLVAATVAVTLRLHLWFTSIVHPSALGGLRARSLRAAFAAECVLMPAIAACGAILVPTHLITAVWLIVTSLLLLLSILVIEPATTSASFDP